MLVRPYRDGGPAINGWDIAGLKTGVAVRGTLNRPGDKDDGWAVEIGMPWAILEEAAPAGRPPRAGDQWRVNFSRVEWQADVRDGRYGKRLDPATGKALPENNWVWSPQGAIAMHMPERWGYVQFSSAPAGKETEPFVAHPDEPVKGPAPALLPPGRASESSRQARADACRARRWRRRRRWSGVRAGHSCGRRFLRDERRRPFRYVAPSPGRPRVISK